MKFLVRYIILIFVFIVSLEAAFKLKYYTDTDFYPKNKTSPQAKYELLWKNESAHVNQPNSKLFRLILIGDSFLDAEEYGGQQSYIPYFKNLANQKNWDFFNFALAGTSINDHVDLLNQIEDNSNNIYVFSIKVHDVLKLDTNDKKTLPLKEVSKEANLKAKLIQWVSKSDAVYLLKDLLHHVFIYLKNTPAPYTHLHKSIITPPESQLSKLNSLLQKLNKRRGKIIVLVNYPYNFKYNLQSFEEIKLYKYLYKMHFSDLILLHSPMIVNEGEGVDWRNVHPNSKSMERVFNYIKMELLSDF